MGISLFRRKRLYLFLICLFFIGLGISAVYRGAVETPARTDLTVYLEGAKAVLNGQNLYEITNSRGWHYVGLPLLAILLAPAASLPLPAAVLGWYLLSVASFFGTLRLASRLLPEAEDAWALAAWASFLALPPLLHSMARGQLGAPLLFLAVAVFYFYRRGCPQWAGLLLGFAIVLKISPMAFLVFFFVFRKEWAAVLWTFLSVLLFAWILPALVLGPELHWTYLGQWCEILKTGGSYEARQSVLWTELLTPFAPDNQSLYAVLTRWTAPSEAGWSPALNPWIRTASVLPGLIALLSLAVRCRLPKKQPNDANTPRLLIEYSLFPVLMLGMAPVAELHHYTVLYLLFLAAGFQWQSIPHGGTGRGWIGAGVLLAFSGFTGGLVSERLSAWGLPLAGCLFLWFVLWRRLGLLTSTDSGK